MDSDKREKSIPASHYTKEYFLSGEYYHSANEYKKFVKGNKPADVYLKAAGYVLQTGSETYLDIGCGKGELVIFLARLRKSVIGIDYSPYAIEICQDALKFATNPVRKHAQFKFADTSHLPFDNDTFDAVFMLDVIEHLTKIEIQKALDELTRVLKKNGKVIIHTNNKYFERGTKLLIAASYHGLKAFLHPKKYLQDATQSDNPYEYMHINYMTAKWLAKELRTRGFEAFIEYPKPKQKSELQKYINYNEKWKRVLYLNLGWLFINSAFLQFFSPTFWLVGKKTET